jgi:DNA-binding NarL/FixJ family response regulator
VTQTARTRVLLVDDDTIDRKGLRAHLETCSDIMIAGEAGSGSEALELVSSQAPDLIITETDMPGMSGAELAGRARGLRREIKVLMLTRCKDPDQVLRSIQAGASAYLEKPATRADLVSAVRRVAEGGRTLPPRVLDVVLRDYQERVASESSPSADLWLTVLTPRQRSVLTLIAEGFTGSQIAAQLGLRPGTVAQHRHRIMLRLGCRNPADLHSFALQAGLVSLDEALL